nr:immunoglobulin heavy chain junction region [Macaca mulatta]MOV50278.1 immunoglobulin heavy chain junction region [Macaca mulatta]MOV52308.1 immunoglobulin heavy chain junction region [Macaca mulatta]
CARADYGNFDSW